MFCSKILNFVGRDSYIIMNFSAKFYSKILILHMSLL